MTEHPRTRPSAGVIIIGDEVLSGKVREQNIAFFTKRFRQLGVSLCRIAIITDELTDIADTVAEFARRFDIVCTSGGIGPTHDDRTLLGVAQASGRPLEANSKLLDLIERHLSQRGRAMSEGYRRMAQAPVGCELVGDTQWPTVKVDNVFIFPGVPRLLVKKFATLEARYFRGAALWSGEVEARAMESEVVVALDGVVARHPSVSIGSYPQMHDDGSWTLRITAEGLNREDVALALEHLDEAFEGKVLRKTGPQSSEG